MPRNAIKQLCCPEAEKPSTKHKTNSRSTRHNKLIPIAQRWARKKWRHKLVNPEHELHISSLACYARLLFFRGARDGVRMVWASCFLFLFWGGVWIVIFLLHSSFITTLCVVTLLFTSRYSNYSRDIWRTPSMVRRFGVHYIHTRITYPERMVEARTHPGSRFSLFISRFCTNPMFHKTPPRETVRLVCWKTKKLTIPDGNEWEKKRPPLLN